MVQVIDLCHRKAIPPHLPSLSGAKQQSKSNTFQFFDVIIIYHILIQDYFVRDQKGHELLLFRGICGTSMHRLACRIKKTHSLLLDYASICFAKVRSFV